MNWQNKQQRHFVIYPLRDTSKLSMVKNPLLPQQKASHQGLDLIIAQQGERPSRQQSCPPAFHPPAINAPSRLTQERPTLTLHLGCLKMRAA